MRAVWVLLVMAAVLMGCGDKGAGHNANNNGNNNGNNNANNNANDNNNNNVNNNNANGNNNTAPECGDGVAVAPEDCDGEDLAGATCLSLGYYGGDLSCAGDCTFDLNGCEAAGRCGDQILQAAHEECDQDDLGGQTCAGLGYDSGQLQCTPTCSFDTTFCVISGSCGDGVLQPLLGESCDSTDLGGQTCPSLQHWSGDLACDANCQFTGCLDLPHVSVGNHHACAHDNLGQGWCWGRGTFGQLGNGSFGPNFYPEPVPVPVVMPVGIEFAQIDSGGSHTCALDLLGNGWCWGRCFDGQLGIGWSPDQNTPQAVNMPAGVTFTTIHAGGSHTCALDTQGNGWCWGSNMHGEVGNGFSSTHFTQAQAVTMPAGVTFTQIAPGISITCALDNTGHAWCWGWGANGQLGNGVNGGPMYEEREPVAVLHPGGVTFTEVGMSVDHACALTAQGDAWCWGNGTDGRLGNGTENLAYEPAAVVMPVGVSFAAISPGREFTCALDTTGQAWCWGGGNNGQLGNGQDGFGYKELTPVQVAMPAGVDFNGISSYSYTCATAPPGAVYCWGPNLYGGLGNGALTNSATPVAVVAP